MSCCKQNFQPVCGCGGGIPVPYLAPQPLYPTNYGACRGNNGFGGIWIIIILLLLFCGGSGYGSGNNGCDDGYDNGCGGGFGGSWIIIIILLLLFSGGSGFGFGC